MQARVKTAKNFGVPLIFSEFGACFAGKECEAEINNSADAFDNGLTSWAYWMYKSFGDHTTSGGTAEGMFNTDGSPQDLKLKAITRTYMHAFEGTPTQMYFNTEDKSFTSTFTYKKTPQPSEVYLNKQIHYPTGFTADLFVNGSKSDMWSLESAGSNNYY